MNKNYHPRTVQEMRAWYDALDQGVKPRARRSPRQLPHRLRRGRD